MPLITRKSNFEKTFRDPLAEDDGGFHFLTSEDPVRSEAKWRTRAAFNTNPRLINERKNFFKTDYGDEFVDLPEITPSGKTHHEVLLARRSQRDFDRGEVTLEQLAGVLYGAGLSEPGGLFRFYPSGGARYPIELYVVVLRVAGVPSGVYHFHAKKRRLGKLNAKAEDFKNVSPADKDHLENAAFAIVTTAVHQRSTIKYGPKGWRLIYLEAGHLGQNLLLGATDQGLGSYPSTSLMDKKTAVWLGLPYPWERTIGAFLFGSVKSV